MRSELVAVMAVAIFVFLAWVAGLLLAVKILVWSITVLVLLVVFVGGLYWIAITWERYRKERAQRLEAERKAQVQVVTAGGQVFISDMNHNAWWNAAHLDPRAYRNSQETYQEPSDFELEAWREFNRPRTIEKVVGQLPSKAEDRPDSLFDLLESYPHLLLVGGTNSGKTTAMNHAVEYRLRQYKRAKVVWLSTHTHLDREQNNLHHAATAIQQPEMIEHALSDLFALYERRRDVPGNYCQVILALDEWPEITSEISNGGEVLRRLSRGGRKCGFSLILASHGSTVADLDLRGFSSVKADFAEVHLLQKLTERNRAIWQPFNRRSQVEIVLPGLFFGVGGRVIEKLAGQLRPSPQEQIVLDLYDQDASFNEIARQVFGSIGGNQTKAIKEILVKFGHVAV